MVVHHSRNSNARVLTALLSAMLALSAGGTVFAQTPVPTTPPVSTTPPPAGTPWPAPTGVTLRGYAILLDAQNFPLPPERQKHFRGIEWAVLSGFTGTYEVQYAVRESSTMPLTALSWSPSAAGPFAAGEAVNGRIGFEELVPTSEQFKSQCFRVRTVINGETGPYSEPLCTPFPPSSGSGPGAAATVAPLPPDVGNTEAGPKGPAAGRIAVALAAMVVLAGATFAVRARR